MPNSIPEHLEARTLRTSAEVVRLYANLSGDHNPLHLDDTFAAATPFGRTIVHGNIALNLLLDSLDATFGTDWREAAEVDIRFNAPAFVGDELRAHGTRQDMNSAVYSIAVTTDSGRNVVTGTVDLHSENLEGDD